MLSRDSRSIDHTPSVFHLPPPWLGAIARDHPSHLLDRRFLSGVRLS